MFESVLIANRGEIACRITRTCRRLGIRTIAVYSAADAGALHVAMADESHPIGPADAASSYLRPDAIITAALAHGASAIHPGYGFLSERVQLAELCEANGIAWVGPSPRCITAMGSKTQAKRIAAEQGISSVPGYHGDDQSPQRLLHEAHSVGFPVLIKASAGGGGRGMRRVDDSATFLGELAIAKTEAMAAFGDDRVLLERFIARPRHLEVQLAGDKHGNLIHLFERECSIQRNYQKLVEEAPASHLPPAVRARLLEAAVRLGRAIGYDSLGTAEFILEADDTQPYFLEMNTRLQVEHPVTEFITGLDLVELQLRIAAGEALPIQQAKVTQQGAAVELRLNAEDPSAAFTPQLGRVAQYREPAGPGVRVDSGVREGSEISPFYDSMLLKLIAHGPQRPAAIRRLDTALRQLVVLGIGTNQAFLRDVIRSPGFNGVLTTRFIPETFPDGWTAPAPSPELLGVAAVAVAQRWQQATRPCAPGPWATLAGFRTAARAGLPGRTSVQLQLPGAAPVTVDVIQTPAGPRAVRRGAVLDPPAELTALLAEDDLVHLASDGAAWTFHAAPLVQALGRRQEREAADSQGVVAAMPGLIAQVLVQPGQIVKRGDVVIVQEAMKLMQPLAAAAEGTVRAVHCTAGQVVTAGALLVEIEPQAPTPPKEPRP